MTTYREFQKSKAPWWLVRQPGEAYLLAQGDMKDALLTRARDGVQARFPDSDIAGDQALGSIGWERQIPRAPNESSAAYAQRLRNAWEIWPWAGTPYGLLRALAESSYTGAFIGTPTKRFSLDAAESLVITNSPWRVAMDPRFWNAFELVFVPPLPDSWGGVVPADNSVHADFVRSMINLWKSAHSICARIIILESGRLWGYPPANWGDPGLVWGGSTTTIWSP